MGCVGSKPEESPAVALCRQRLSFLDDAIHQRYALAEAHIAYIDSLRNVGFTLHEFFEFHSKAPADNFSPESPKLSLPKSRKGERKAHNDHDHIESDGESHLHFHSSDDEEGGSDEDDMQLHSVGDSPIRHTTHLPYGNFNEHSENNHNASLGLGSSSGNYNYPQQMPYFPPPPAGYPPNGYPDVNSYGSNGFGYQPEMNYPPMGNYRPPPSGYPPMDFPPSGYPQSSYTNYMRKQPTPSVVYQQRPASPEAIHYGEVPGYAQSGYTMNYMRKQPTPSVVYQQQPMNPEAIRYGEASSSGSYYNSNSGNANANGYGSYQDPSFYSNGNGYANANYGEFFGESSRQPPPPYGGMGAAPSSYGGMGAAPSPYGGEASMSAAKAAAAAPPPPPPPASSTWDFLNPFETFESYYPPYTPSRDSREVREEEGIPDLEDEDSYQEEVVKEIHSSKPKFVDVGGGGAGTSGGGGNVDSKKAPVDDEESDLSSVDELHYRNGPTVHDDEPVEFEVHVVEKGETSRGAKPVHEFHSDSEVVKEIQAQFDRASESGNELAKMLEVGKVPHNRKHAAYQVSAKMLNVVSPSLAVAVSKHSDPANLDVDADLRTKSNNLSSTLHKIYLWEKKLLEEVKVEEKMRILHDEKDRRLKRLDEKGAEQEKVDATRTLVRSLSTKIGMAIQVVDKISVQINRLRDEELWPQLNNLIQGLTRMWRSMLECHHSQCQAIGAAKRLDAIASNKHFSDDSLEAKAQLERELLNWTVRLSCWFGAQKGFVTSLNNWLLKCLLYIPEETADGPVPFSPSRIGAPTIFIICNQWAQAIDRISDKEVLETMRDFVRVVAQLWERDKEEMRRRFAMHKNMESKVRSLDREKQKIQKGLQVLDKQIVLSSGEGNSAVYQSETSKSVSAQTNLRLVFEAMERFTAASLKVCEELLQRIEEDRISRQQANVS